MEVLSIARLSQRFRHPRDLLTVDPTLAKCDFLRTAACKERLWPILVAPSGRGSLVAAMKVTRTEIPNVLLLQPRIFGDERGFFRRAGMRASSIAPLGPTSNSSKTTILVPPAVFCVACTTR
jgi:hypothetical protein